MFSVANARHHAHMCGIAGLYAKSPEVADRLGAHLSAMLGQLGDRGPDSAGVAIYRDPVLPGQAKVSLLDPAGGGRDWAALGDVVADRGDQAVLCVDDGFVPPPELTVMGSGRAIEVAKRAGHPAELIATCGLEQLSGTHAVAHTRMATESRVTTNGSHPFSTGDDLCLVHNGSLSNHNLVRRDLRRRGIEFATENDSEVAAGFLTWRLAEGDSLEEALGHALHELDGFFTFAVGTYDGFAVLRDPVACKPAVLAETDDWVAVASEHRALAVLPGSDDADLWEPTPGRVYAWSGAGAGAAA